MSEQIFYSAEGMVEAAAEAQALVRAMEDTQSRFRTIKTMLNMSLSSVHELSITDRHVSFDKKNMQNQIDQMTRFAETLARAAEYTDSTNGYMGTIWISSCRCWSPLWAPVFWPSPPPGC